MVNRPLLPGLGKRPLVVASLDNLPRLSQDARAARRAGADVIEVRADAFPRATLRPEPLRDVLEALQAHSPGPVIFTLRSRAEGGGLPGGFSEVDRLNLFRAAMTEVDLVDIEISAEEIGHHVIFEAHKRGRGVILSHHNFKKVPPTAALRALLRKARGLEADIVKVAAQPRTPSEALAFMTFCRAADHRLRVFIPMGPLGSAYRVDGFFYGSCLTYAHWGRVTAPGQFSVPEVVGAINQLFPRKTSPGQPLPLGKN